MKVDFYCTLRLFLVSRIIQDLSCMTTLTLLIAAVTCLHLLIEHVTPLWCQLKKDYDPLWIRVLRNIFLPTWKLWFPPWSAAPSQLAKYRTSPHAASISWQRDKKKQQFMVPDLMPLMHFTTVWDAEISDLYCEKLPNRGAIFSSLHQSVESGVFLSQHVKT